MKFYSRKEAEDKHDKNAMDEKYSRIRELQKAKKKSYLKSLHVICMSYCGSRSPGVCLCSYKYYSLQTTVSYFFLEIQSKNIMVESPVCFQVYIECSPHCTGMSILLLVILQTYSGQCNL